MLSRRVSVLTILRVATAVSGAGLWAYWWQASTRLTPQIAFALWMAALALFALACFSPWTVSRPTRVTGAAALILAFATLPRVLGLTWAPYNVTLDEVIHPLNGLEMLRQHPWDIAGGASWYFATPFLTQALQAWPCLVLQPLLGARIATVVLALASLLSTYVLARRLFGAGTGLLALVVLACSYWHMAYSRMAYPYMQPILLVPLALHVLLRGVTESHRFLQFVGGLLLGASLLVYTPARIVIPIFLLWLLHRLITRALRLRAVLPVVALIAVGAALALSPYIHRQGVEGVWLRYNQTAAGESGPLHEISVSGWTSAAARARLLKQFEIALRVYFSGGGIMAVSDFAPAPLVDHVSLALALIGLGIACARLRDDRCFLLVTWIAATFLVAQVLTDLPASAYRAAPLLPALAICAGFAATRVGAWARSRWSACDRPLPQLVAMLGLVAVILPSNLKALEQYVRPRASESSGMARLIAAGSTTAAYYIVSSGPAARHELFQFFGAGRSIRDVSSLMDVLGGGVDPQRDAVFVLSSEMVAAAVAIKRCYPGAIFETGPYPVGPKPVLGVFVSQPAVAAGQHCAVAKGSGLRARYFTGKGWDGTVRRERFEDWQPRWSTQQDASAFGSVEWTGSIRLPVAGEYRFQLIAYGVHDSAEVGDHVRVPAQQFVGAVFQPGTYSLRIRCETLPGTVCWLRWAPPGSDFDAISPEFLTVPADVVSVTADSPPPAVPLRSQSAAG